MTNDEIDERILAIEQFIQNNKKYSSSRPFSSQQLARMSMTRDLLPRSL